jgi:alkylation response protein AidB-like acyl-CoA dehydrogenase
MDFAFSDEQQALRRSIRGFAEGVVGPIAAQHDDAGTVPKELLPKLAEMGLLGILFPEELGGAGMGYVEYVIILEELARVDPSTALTVAAHNSLGTNHIYTHGSDEQRRRFVPDLARGEKIAAWALTEPGSGSDAAGLKTTARREGSDWVLDGTKSFITNATIGSTAVVLALTKGEDARHGVTAFICDIGAKGCRAGKKENKLGMRTSDTAELVLESHRVGDDRRLGAEHAGFTDALKVLDGGRISIAALSLGITLGCLDQSRRYAKQRKAFGQPIADFQAIQWILADMEVRYNASALLTYKAAVMKDQKRRTTMQSAMAKLYASDTCAWAAERAVQLFGGYGFIKDFPVEKFYRDCKLCTIGEGTSEVQRLVIARQLVGSA